MKQTRQLAFSSKFTNLSSWKTCEIAYSHIGLSNLAEMIMQGTDGSGVCVCSDIDQLHFYDSLIFKSGTVIYVIGCFANAC